jgi:hypothetical protein
MRTRGPEETVKFIKNLRAYFVASLTGADIRAQGFKVIDGYPRCFGDKLIKLLKEDSYRRFIAIRILLTILYSTRA